MKKFFLIVIFIFLSLIILSTNSFADTFSVSLPAGTAVTMGDSSATLPLTITNNGPGDIRQISFLINTSVYNFSEGIVPPSGWCVKSWNPDELILALEQPGGSCASGSTSAKIAPNNSLTFNIIFTGPGGGNIPAAASDVTDNPWRGNGIVVDVQGGFSLSGSLPTWTRKSLAITLSASPSSVGVGDSITVTMNVTNRSTATKSGIAGNPDPPSRTYTGGASVAPIGVAAYGSTSSTVNPPPTTLSNNINAAATTINVSSTTGYPASGRIMIDNELIDYPGTTATSFTGCTRGVSGTTAASHNSGAIVYSQNTTAFTLTSGESSTITWTFRADATGTVYFTSSARNSGGTATSKSASSNVVLIGDFTVSISVTPLTVISGQTVTVTMTVKNNGTSALTNVIPALTPLGTATKTWVSGPTPASISSLAPGESGTFQWGYTITGSVGQTYYFSGYASSGGTNSNTATSETGSIGKYSVTLVPASITTGSTNVTLSWTVFNGGGTIVREVGIIVPRDAGGNIIWACSGGIPPANWTVADASPCPPPPDRVLFRAQTPYNNNGILPGTSKTFSITFSTIPNVTVDTPYSFEVIMTDVGNRESGVTTTVIVTAYLLTLTVYDEDCTSAALASKPADGDSRYCMKARLTSGGSPASGKPIYFNITSGTGILSPGSPILTDSNGYATVYLISPCSTTNTSTTVKAEYTVDTYDTETVQFTGVGGSNLSYVSGSLTPVSVTTGYSSGFSLQLRNCGVNPLTILTSNTTLALKQNSPDTFALTSSTTINAGATAILNFNSKAVSSAIFQCPPLLTVNAGAGYTGTFSYYKTPRGDSLTDTVTVNNGTTCPPARVRILDWREVQ